MTDEDAVRKEQERCIRIIERNMRPVGPQPRQGLFAGVERGVFAALDSVVTRKRDDIIAAIRKGEA
jgi:hypothetical protein